MVFPSCGRLELDSIHRSLIGTTKFDRGYRRRMSTTSSTKCYPGCIRSRFARRHVGRPPLSRFLVPGNNKYAYVAVRHIQSCTSCQALVLSHVGKSISGHLNIRVEHLSLPRYFHQRHAPEPLQSCGTYHVRTDLGTAVVDSYPM